MFKINDVFTLWKTGGGVFSILSKLGYSPPWNSNPINNDYLYHGNHGGKPISPLLETVIDDRNIIQSADVEKIVGLLISLYSDKWDKLYETVVAIYDPLTNYSRETKRNGETANNNTVSTETAVAYGGKTTDTDTTTVIETENNSKSIAYGKTENTTVSKTDEKTVSETDSTTHGKTVETVNTKSAFDSAEFVNDTKTNETNGGKDITAKTGTENITGTETNTKTDSGTDTETNSTTANTTHGGTVVSEKTGTDTTTTNTTNNNSGTNSYTETVKGTNGDTVSLLEKQRRYLNYDFLFQIFADIDNVLSIPIY